MRGVVLAIEQADREIGCMREIEPAKETDSADTYWFYRIKGSEKAGDDVIILNMKMTPGKKAIPVIDISVHEEAAPKTAMDEINGVV